MHRPIWPWCNDWQPCPTYGRPVQKYLVPSCCPWNIPEKKEESYNFHHQEEQLEELLCQTKEMVDIVEVLEQVWKCMQSPTD